MTEPIDSALDALLRRCLTAGELDRYERIRLGYSRALVFALPPDGRDAERTFIKIDRVDSANSLFVEQSVLQQLAEMLPVPRVLAFDQVGEHWVLRMSAMPGIDASDVRLHAQPERLVVALAQAIKRMHDLPIQPYARFDRRLDVSIAEAERRMRNGQVDMEDLDEERHGMSIASLRAQLHTRRPAGEDLVPTHGDYCLPNVLFEPDTLALTGFIDLGRFGVADRHQDVALALRSLRHNLNRDFTALFATAYGMPVDPDKLAYYQLLDEFF